MHSPREVLIDSNENPKNFMQQFAKKTSYGPYRRRFEQFGQKFYQEYAKTTGLL